MRLAFQLEITVFFSVCYVTGYTEKNGIRHECRLKRDLSQRLQADCSNQSLAGIFPISQLHKMLLPPGAILPTDELLCIDTLTLARNKLVGFEGQLAKAFPCLRSLDLQSNSFGNDDVATIRSMSLQILDLSKNNIEDVNSEAFRYVSNLTKLDLSHNVIRALSREAVNALATLGKLQELSLSYTGLTTLPVQFGSKMAHLQVLDVSGNRLTNVPFALSRMTHLMKLRLDNNPVLTLVPGEFHGLKNLRYLSVSHMPLLESIRNHSLTTLISLATLKCSNNGRLVHLHEFSLWNGRRESWTLRKVDLSNNAFQNLPRKLMPWDLLRSIDLRGNRLHCSDILWLKDKVHASQTRPKIKHSRCAESNRTKRHVMISRDVTRKTNSSGSFESSKPTDHSPCEKERQCVVMIPAPPGEDHMKSKQAAVMFVVFLVVPTAAGLILFFTFRSTSPYREYYSWQVPRIWEWTSSGQEPVTNEQRNAQQELNNGDVMFTLL